ncbi:hypothetical protein [Dictyobacter kobayashii]|uniref:Uncharacterized protein n=1 Tax=Dictyobacter kobayashii TaxID=2014872 RepID=A0A402AQX4_9CHLR|nr:hypothetical protein [Dictyobacter kobayashii]GCE21494.1 hypothetical protein KDK_52940 [Dictyobacter kobayashii]
MHFVSTTRWTLNWSFDPTVDFCLWLLEHDGLQVPPFTAHPITTSSVPEGQLTADEWKNWLVAVVNALDTIFEAGPARRWPPQIWQGNAAEGERLAQLWQKSYPSVQSAREQRSTKRHGIQGLYEELEPYRGYIPNQLRIELIDYPVPISWLCTPTTLLLSTAYNSLSDAEIKALICQELDTMVATTGAAENWKELYWQEKQQQEPPWQNLLNELSVAQQPEWRAAIEQLRKSTVEVQNMLFQRFRLLNAIYREGPRTGTIHSIEQLTPEYQLVSVTLDGVTFSNGASSIQNPTAKPLEIGQQVEIEVEHFSFQSPNIIYRLIS